MRKLEFLGRYIGASAATAMGTLNLLAVPVAAQTPAEASAAANAARPICSVQSSANLKMSIGDDTALMAFCGSHLVPLGPADDFEVMANQSARAILVDIRKKWQRKVILISLQAGDHPLAEDVSGQISLGAGRGPVSSIADLDIDFDRFASDGIISFRTTPTTGKSARNGTIDLKHQVEAARAAGLGFSASN